MRKYLLQLFTRPIRAGIKWYLSKPRDVKYNNITITVLPDVFHPGLFHSTKIVLDFLSTQNIKGRKFLELGCGSGLISVYASQKGAVVTASDINTKAIENVLLNATRNQVEVEVIHSDLFTKMPDIKWDWIIINPPYYPADPTNEAEFAWYCGQEHQYFENLFKSLSKYSDSKSHVLMILSEVCDLQKIFSIATAHDFTFEKITEKKVWVDGRNYLYWIKEKQ